MPTPLQNRIIHIQRKLNLSETGVINLATCAGMERILAITITATTLLKRIEAIQYALGFRGGEVDGLVGVNTVSRIELLISSALPNIPTGASLIVSKKSLGDIISSEVTSKSHYERKLIYPTVPPEESGVTIGIGYDLGHVTKSTFRQDWGDLLSPTELDTLSFTIGKKGNAARAALTSNVLAIVVTWDKAMRVFYERSMPVWGKRTKSAYPGLQKLPPDAQGALVSLVYNRGMNLTDRPGETRRLEMRNIKPLVASGNLLAIASEIRAMKRLWDINRARGLHTRRDNEANLVEFATFNMLPNEFIFI